MSAQEATFESEEQMKVETTQMQQAMDSDTVSELVNSHSESQREHAYQEEAQRNIEEASIIQEVEVGDLTE